MAFCGVFLVPWVLPEQDLGLVVRADGGTLERGDLDLGDGRHGTFRTVRDNVNTRQKIKARRRWWREEKCLNRERVRCLLVYIICF